MKEKERKKIAEEFGDLTDKLRNELMKAVEDATMGSLKKVMQDSSKNYLNNLLEKTTDIIKKFEEGGKNIAKVNDNLSKSLTVQLNNIRKKSNELLLKRNELEIQKATANRNQIKKINLQIKENEIFQQQLEANQTVLKQLEKIIDAEKKLSDEKANQNNLLHIGKGLSIDFLKNYAKFFIIKEALEMILKAAIELNKVSVDIGRNFGFGEKKADTAAKRLRDIAYNSKNVNVTLKNVNEAMNELNEYTGLVSQYSTSTLETQIMLTKQFGLTADEAAGIYKFSVLNNKSSKEINENMVDAFVSARNQLRVGVPFKATLAEASKISGQLAANFQNNPGNIVKAVIQAKALGTALEQTKQQSNYLLDFESSIENELKAELLLNQSMNLEKARAAALMGDQVTVMQELTNQGMTLEKFQRLNVVTQEAFAQAVGLNADQLADQLTKQQIAIKSGKSFAEITKNEAIEAQKRQNIQEKFNAAIEKLEDLLGNILSGPIGGLLDAITNILSKTWALNSILAGALFWNIYKALMGFKQIKKIVQETAIAEAWAAAFKNPGMAIGSAVIATSLTALAMNAFNRKQVTEDGIAPPGNGPFTITDGFGRTSVTHERDGLVVSPNISRQNSTKNDNMGIIAAINDLQKAINNKNFNPILQTTIDGSIVATTSAQNSYNLA